MAWWVPHQLWSVSTTTMSAGRGCRLISAAAPAAPPSGTLTTSLLATTN